MAAQPVLRLPLAVRSRRVQSLPPSLLPLTIHAALRAHANPDVTPNPAKAPWYFLGLQELLHYFPPSTGGVLVPGLVLVALAVLAYVDRNPSRAYTDRKVAIITFTMF